MLITLLYILFFASCVALIATVLLQPGKTDAGALFTSSVSSTAFGARGTATLLSKITIAAAATFMLTALLIAMPALSGNISVLDTVSETTEAPKTDANTATNVTTDANTATNITTDANANVTSNSAVNAAPSNTSTNVAPANTASDKKEEPKKDEKKP
jgi:preprotein translocase subunit SecG